MGKKKIKSLVKEIESLKSTIAEINDKLELLQAGDRILNRRLFEQEANVVGIKRELHQRSNTSGE